MIHSSQLVVLTAGVAFAELVIVVAAVVLFAVAFVDPAAVAAAAAAVVVVTIAVMTTVMIHQIHSLQQGRMFHYQRQYPQRPQEGVLTSWLEPRQQRTGVVVAAAAAAAAAVVVAMRTEADPDLVDHLPSPRPLYQTFH